MSAKPGTTHFFASRQMQLQKIAAAQGFKNVLQQLGSTLHTYTHTLFLMFVFFFFWGGGGGGAASLQPS